MLTIIQPAKFACGRTCTPGHLCQFSPILNAIGDTRVMSHTVRVTVALKSKSALAEAVKGLGGEVLGDGIHRVAGQVAGFGFKLAGQYWPMVLTADATLAYESDVSNSKELIDELTKRYTIEVAREAADAQGWSSEDQEDGGLLIRVGSGATMTVQPDGTVEGFGFIGQACDVAQVIEDAIGTPGAPEFKPEYFTHTSLNV